VLRLAKVQDLAAKARDKIAKMRFPGGRKGAQVCAGVTVLKGLIVVLFIYVPALSPFGPGLGLAGKVLAPEVKDTAGRPNYFY